LNADLSQGNVASCLSGADTYSHHVTANLLLMKEFWKPVSIWQS